MRARRLQISFDVDLLHRVDADLETQARGASNE
jgi:hypothetical protein